MTACPCCGRKLVDVQRSLDVLHPTVIVSARQCPRFPGLKPHYSKAVRFVRFEEAT